MFLLLMVVLEKYGTGATDHILMEDETGRGDQYGGSKIVMEGETNSSLNDITDIFLINNGSGYNLITYYHNIFRVQMQMF